MKDFCLIAHFLTLILILDVTCWKMLNEHSIFFYREKPIQSSNIKNLRGSVNFGALLGQQLVDLLLVSSVFLFINIMDIISLKCIVTFTVLRKLIVSILNFWIRLWIFLVFICYIMLIFLRFFVYLKQELVDVVTLC